MPVSLKLLMLFFPFYMEMLFDFALNLLFLAVLLVLSGFFSMSETALVSLDRLRLRQLVSENRKNALLVKKLKADPHKMLITILIGNNLVNVAASAIAAVLAVGAFGSLGVGIVTFALTLIILVFGEITPKSVATSHSERISLFVARPLYFLSRLLSPLIFFLDWISTLIMFLVGLRKRHPDRKLTENQLKDLVELGAKEGAIEHEEKELVHKVFRFGDISVKEIMKPKKDMMCLDADKTLRDALGVIIASGLTRFPVYRGSLENFAGILNTNDLLRFVREKKLDKRVGDVMVSPLFVSQNEKIDDVMETFQDTHRHMALVLKAPGKVSGLITLEDIIEELVGEIQDETD